MLIGAFFGIFEEVVPLVPIMIALSYAMGWDTLVGLGMSILATNMGFSAAITNPFTIGVAQKIAGLPLAKDCFRAARKANPRLARADRAAWKKISMGQRTRYKIERDD